MLIGIARSSSASFSFVWLCIGCGGGPSGDGGSDAGIDATAALTGSALVSHHFGDQVAVTAIDLSATPIRAWLHDPRTGDFQVYDGTGNVDGTYGIQVMMSKGRSWIVQVGDEYFASSDPELDLGWDELGRPNSVPSVLTPTLISITADGMNAWRSPGDSLHFFVPNLGESALSLEWLGMNPPWDGETTVTDLTFDWSGHSLVSGGDGDRAIAVQLVTQVDTVDGWVAVAGRQLELAPFDQVDGELTTLVGTFSAIPPVDSTQLHWQGPAFSTMLADVHPLAQSDMSASVDIIASLPDVPPWNTASWEPLLRAFVWMPDLDHDFGEVGLPIAASPATIVSLVSYYSYRVDVTLPGTLPFEASLYATDVRDIASVGAQGIAPLVSPPANVEIAGMPAWLDPVGVTTTPHVTWDAPHTGSADQYIMVISRASPDTGRTDLQYVATLYLEDNEIWLPPGILMPDVDYVFYLASVHCPGIDLGRSPFRYARPFSTVWFVSGFFRT